MTHPALADPRIASLLQAYHSADYRWEHGGQWHPLVIGSASPSLERAFPDARSFGLLSAWNPHSVERPDAVNRTEDERLATFLSGNGLAHRAAFSSARNRSWREPSWIVMDMPLDAFDALARDFGQLSTIYAWRGEPARLRMYRHPPAEHPELDAVDWVH